MQVPWGYGWAGGAEHLGALVGPVALLPTLNRDFAMSFGLTCLSAIAASMFIPVEKHMAYIDVTDMS